MTDISLVRVFPNSETGGNPAPTVLNAEGMSDQDMRLIAGRYGLESGFVLPPQPSSEADYCFRFFVPEHEMEMCGHATIGALWLLREKGLITDNSLLIDTLSGPVRAYVPEKGTISISQPEGVVNQLSIEGVETVLGILGLKASDLAQKPGIMNSCTSRVKTLIALKDRQTLDALTPDFNRMEEVCSLIGSTGLYPFAPGAEPDVFHARQFPRSSGYPEDAATGIAASALAFGLLGWAIVKRNDRVTIRQGEAMGHASEIIVTFDGEEGCWIHGDCRISPCADSI